MLRSIFLYTYLILTFITLSFSSCYDENIYLTDEDFVFVEGNLFFDIEQPFLMTDSLMLELCEWWSLNGNEDSLFNNYQFDDNFQGENGNDNFNWAEWANYEDSLYNSFPFETENQEGNGNNNYDIEFSTESLPDTASIGDILYVEGQFINHGPDTYEGSLALIYTVVDSLPETYPISSPFSIFWEEEFTEEAFINVDETIYFSDNQSIVVTEETFKKGQKNIIIIWPVDLISDTNPDNNYAVKEIYIYD